VQKFQEEVAEEDKCIFAWWKENSARYPLLSQLARKYLCIPASTASSKRSFSTAGLIITPLRNGLDEQTARMMTKMSFNKKNLSP